MLTPPAPPTAGGIPLPAQPLPPPPAGVVPFSVSESGTPHSVTGPDEQDVVSVGNDVNAEPDRTARRLYWTEVEELRLVSAWLNSFRLSNAKKYKVYWAMVAGMYNRNTPKDRRRSHLQLKCHWQKINAKIAHFYDCWCRVEAKYSSVQSEKMQLMDKTWAMYNEEAREMYLEEAKRHFTFSHCWKAVWDQPKWKKYVSSVCYKKTKLSESGDCTSSSEDAEDAPEIETGEEGSMPVKKHKVKGKAPSPSSELQEDIRYSVDPQNMIGKNDKEMIGAELQCSDQKLELARTNQLEMKGKEMEISRMQTGLLMADTPRILDFQHERDRLMADTARVIEFQHGSAVREDVPEKKTHPPQGHKTVEHAGTERVDLPENETHQRGSKKAKSKRKLKGNTSSPPSEVQEDIKRAVDLQTMLQKDREKMSEAQFRLSKEKLELARLKQQEAKDRKETILYEKYTELLMADTHRFDGFQKEEHRKAVKRMGEMLFGNDGVHISSDNLKHM
nr:unnamed protein product [Digitaria exilis]